MSYITVAFLTLAYMLALGGTVYVLHCKAVMRSAAHVIGSYDMQDYDPVWDGVYSLQMWLRSRTVYVAVGVRT